MTTTFHIGDTRFDLKGARLDASAKSGRAVGLSIRMAGETRTEWLSRAVTEALASYPPTPGRPWRPWRP